MSELLACADLIRKGYEVFRSVSQAATCDILALKDGKTYRVEVKTAYRLKNGKIAHCRPILGRFDVLALVVDGTCFYDPPI